MTDQSLPPSTPQDPTRALMWSLIAGGIAVIVVAVYLGATVDPVLYAVAAFALIDFGLAWLYRSGRIGPTARRRRAAQSSGEE